MAVNITREVRESMMVKSHPNQADTQLFSKAPVLSYLRKRRMI